MEMFRCLLTVVITAALVECGHTPSAHTSGPRLESKDAVTYSSQFLSSTEDEEETLYNYYTGRSSYQGIDLGPVLSEDLIRNTNLTAIEDGRMSLRTTLNNYTNNEVSKCSNNSSTLATARDILDPIFFPIVFILGLILNGILLYIYWKHDELHTRRNALLINLTVSDTLFLLVFGASRIPVRVLNLRTKCYQQHLCQFYVFSLCVWASLGAYSIALISMQRYLRSVEFKKPITKRVLRIFAGPASLITTVWVLSIVLAMPEVARSRYIHQVFHCKDPNLFKHGAYPFMLYGVVPFAIAALFYWAVQRLPLRGQVACELLKKDRPGRVLLSLGFVYVLTYAPVLLCDLLSDRKNDALAVQIYCYVSKLIHFSNPILCPLALCFASGRLRRYFWQYLLRFCVSKDVCNSRRTASHTSLHTTLSNNPRSSAIELTVFKETREKNQSPIPGHISTVPCA